MEWYNDLTNNKKVIRLMTNKTLNIIKGKVLYKEIS